MTMVPTVERTTERILLEAIIKSLRHALEKASPDVFAALSLAEIRLKGIAEEEQKAQGPQPKRPRKKVSGKVVNLRPTE
jgi:hypothetical protein